MSNTPEAPLQEGQQREGRKRFVNLGAVAVVAGFVWDCVQFCTPLGTVVMFLWLLYRPDRFHPSVDSAVLAALQLTAPSPNATKDQRASLRYDLAIDLSFRNSHSRLSIRYLDVSATTFYNGSTKLGPSNDALPSPFKQGPKNTTVLHPAFRGTLDVDSTIAAELQREIAAGTVHVTVRVSITLMYRVWPISKIFFYKYDCRLGFPPPRRAAPASFHAGTPCWAIQSKDK